MSDNGDSRNPQESAPRSLEQEISFVRARICDWVLIALSLIGGPAVVASIIRSVETGWRPMMSVQVAMIFCLWGVTLARRPIPFHWRALFLVFLFLALGVGSLVTWGLTGGALVLFFTAATVATILFGAVGALSALSISGMVLALTGVAVSQGIIELSIDANAYNRSLIWWGTTTLSLILLGGAVSVGIIRLNKALVDFIRRLKKHELELESLVEKRTEALRRSQDGLRKLSRAVTQSPAAVIITDTKGDIEYVNPRFTDMFGFGSKEALGRNPRILKSDDTEPAVYEGLWSALASDTEWRSELQNKKKDGEPIWVSTSVSPIKDEGGTTTHYVAVEEDITERKKAEEKLADAYAVISSSIEYASKIQRSILPNLDDFASVLGEYLVIWEPRDVVGGDIYWHRPWGDGVLVILADCTGHGVPGAFMTMIATGALDRAQEEVVSGQLGKLVQRMHQLVQLTLGQHVDEGESDDGLELGACYLDSDLATITYCGARFELFQVADGEIEITKGTKRGIGYRGISFVQEYEEFTLPVVPGTGYFLTTDGLIDQVGGKKRRSFGKKRFSELLLSARDLPMALQRECVLQTLTEFQGEEIRRDDVSVIGFRIN